MNPRISPSMKTWGRIATRSSKSMRYRATVADRARQRRAVWTSRSPPRFGVAAAMRARTGGALRGHAVGRGQAPLPARSRGGPVPPSMAGAAVPAFTPAGWWLLLRGRRGDGQPLHFLVVAPLLRVVAGHLEHEVERLLRVALVVELDRARDARVLHGADRLGD